MGTRRADLVSAGLRVLHEHGLEQCSMRRVAAELQLQPSALYHHVANKQTLLSLMADEIVRGVDGSDARAVCLTLRESLLAVRDGAEVVAAASAFRLGASAVEGRLARLVGIDGARTLLLYTFAHAQATQTQLQASALGALPASPGVPGPAPDPDPEAAFERGIGIILSGLGAG